MTIFDILTLVFGLSLFLFGMTLMGDTLKKSAGTRLKTILEKLTGNPLKGFALGLAVTAVIQSSGATTVMVVGFVNSGTMLLSQAVGVILGANIGTTVTGWLTALSGIEGGGTASSVLQWFKPSTFTPIVALIGLVLYMLCKNDKKKNLGLIFLGFSVLMLGMETMSGAVSGLVENETFRSVLLMFENPLLGVLAGFVMTAILQSSSATIGILQSFTATGAITFGNAVPIIMGQNIGACAPALISTVGTSKNAKRTAMVQLLSKIIGTLICMPVFYVLKNVFNVAAFNGSIDMWGIAVMHTSFNIITAAILLPLSKQIEKLTFKIIRNKDENNELELFDERLLATPSVALERSREGTLKMAELSVKAFDKACSLIGNYDGKTAQKIREYEGRTDEYEDKLGTYLVRASEASILDGEKREANMLLHMIGDFERISDHAVNIAESAEEMKDKNVVFSETAQRELSVLISAVREITSLSYEAINTDSYELAASVEPLEQVVDMLRDEIKKNHILRLQRNECTIEHGFVLSDILNNLERVADHCSNIAGCFAEMSRNNALDLHKYLNEYKSKGEKFDELYKAYSEKYTLKE